MDSMRQGAQSVLSFAPLTHAIFDALWNDLVVHKIHCNLQFRRLHDNQEWMATFRQFYQNFRPHDHARSLDAWHLSWLDGLDKAPLQSSPETVLDDLIQFILTTHEYIDRTAEPTGPMRRYSSIEVLVDGTETLSCSSSGIEKLQRDAETICTYFHSHLVVKLFLDALPGCLPQLDAMPCVRRGLAQVVRLPAWTKEQLLALVAERLRAARPGEFRDNLNLADILPNEAIIASLRPNLSELIVQGALQIYQQDGSEDAPVHMLRLARNVAAAAAGCKTERYMPPLGTNEVRALITEYWTRQ
jgi:hypothetical protein